MKKEKKKEKASKNTLLIIILILIFAGVGAVAGIYVYKTKYAKVENSPQNIEKSYYDVGEILVNLADKNGKRYAKANVSLGYDKKNKDLESELEEKKVPIKDVCIFYLKSLTSTNFSTDQEEVIKSALTEKINNELKDGVIIDVLFTDLLIQ